MNEGTEWAHAAGTNESLEKDVTRRVLACADDLIPSIGVPHLICFRALTYHKDTLSITVIPRSSPSAHVHTMSSRLLADYPSLATYTEDQLKDLLTQDDYLDAFLYSLPQVQGVLERQQELSRTNDELASTSLWALFHLRAALY